MWPGENDGTSVAFLAILTVSSDMVMIMTSLVEQSTFFDTSPLSDDTYIVHMLKLAGKNLEDP